MPTNPDRDPLEQLLNRSAPPISELSEEVVRELDRLAHASAAPVAHRRTRRAPVLAGVLSAVIIGSAATAAAASTEVMSWMPWAEAPDAVATFTLPSGAQCEHRIGGVQGNDPAAVDIVEQYYRTVDTAELLEPDKIAATIAQLRTEETRGANADGSTEPGGHGTSHYSADEEYLSAAMRLLGEGVSSELEAAGIDGADSDLSFGGQTDCPGAQW